MLLPRSLSDIVEDVCEELCRPQPVKMYPVLEAICDGFVCTSKTNRKYYRVILTMLWPKDDIFPGPRTPAEDIRKAIDRFRRHQDPNAKPYQDPFRRVIELQMEEGLVGLRTIGSTYQLVSPEVGTKLAPRIHLKAVDWEPVLSRYHGGCAICSNPDGKLCQDHKVPRTRGGGNELANWQPLCTRCNNRKQKLCMGCVQDCLTCSLAFPEFYKDVHLDPATVRGINEFATALGEDPGVVANRLIAQQLVQISKLPESM